MTRGNQLTTEAIVQYLLLICAEHSVDDDRAGMEVHDDRAELETAPAGALGGPAAERHGILMVGGPRQAPAMEATLEFRGGDVTITDGPYARMHGQIRGFDVVDRAQLEEVIELASRPNSP
jgi:hypothetical protein